MPCFGQWILNHWTTSEDPSHPFLSLLLLSYPLQHLGKKNLTHWSGARHTSTLMISSVWFSPFSLGSWLKGLNPQKLVTSPHLAAFKPRRAGNRALGTCVIKCWTGTAAGPSTVLQEALVCACVCAQALSRVRHFATPWTAALKSTILCE